MIYMSCSKNRNQKITAPIWRTHSKCYFDLVEKRWKNAGLWWQLDPEWKINACSECYLLLWRKYIIEWAKTVKNGTKKYLHVSYYQKCNYCSEFAELASAERPKNNQGDNPMGQKSESYLRSYGRYCKERSLKNQQRETTSWMY